MRGRDGVSEHPLSWDLVYSALLAMQSAVLATVILSVRPWRSGIVSRRTKIRSCGFQPLLKTIIIQACFCATFFRRIRLLCWPIKPASQ